MRIDVTRNFFLNDEIHSESKQQQKISGNIYPHANYFFKGDFCNTSLKCAFHDVNFIFHRKTPKGFSGKKYLGGSELHQ